MSLYWNNKIASGHQCKGVGILISAITAPQASAFLCSTVAPVSLLLNVVRGAGRNKIGKIWSIMTFC
jgi:hypothetical protein